MEAHLEQMRLAQEAPFQTTAIRDKEAATLLEPAAQEGLHIGPAFARGANFIWTADSHPEGRFWLVYFHDGTFACETPQFNAWVRAVRASC